METVKYNYVEIVEKLLKTGADMNVEVKVSQGQSVVMSLLLVSLLLVHCLTVSYIIVHCAFVGDIFISILIL